MRQEIAERRKNREADAPAVAVLRTEDGYLPKDVGFRDRCRKLAVHSLGDDEPNVMCKAVIEPPAPVRGGIGMAERGLHPDIAAAHFDRADGRVIRP